MKKEKIGLESGDICPWRAEKTRRMEKCRRCENLAENFFQNDKSLPADTGRVFVFRTRVQFIRRNDFFPFRAEKVHYRRLKRCGMPPQRPVGPRGHHVNFTPRERIGICSADPGGDLRRSRFRNFGRCRAEPEQRGLFGLQIRRGRGILFHCRIVGDGKRLPGVRSEDILRGETGARGTWKKTRSGMWDTPNLI